MLPNFPKSQFRTPFRGQRDTTRSPVSIQSQSPEPLLAATPNPVIACSQMSTPGITVDAIKAMIRKSPSKKKTKGARVINREMPSKTTGTKNVRSHGFSSHPDRSNARNGINEARMTSSVGRKENIRKEKKPSEHGGTRKKLVLSGNFEAHGECPSETIFQPSHYSDYETVNQGGDNGPVIPMQIQITESNPISRKKITAVRNSVQNSIKKVKQSQLVPIAPGVSQNEVIKSGKTHITKKKAKRNHILEKWYPAHTLSTSEDTMSGSVDQIVIVGESDYVYRDVCEEPADPMRETVADVYVFTSTSSDEQTTMSGKNVGYRRRKDQIRLQVLKTIYKIETELAVLRDRRKQLGRKIGKSTQVGDPADFLITDLTSVSRGVNPV